jgi:ABC-type Fe2+-enterobactin transport system substrate-binding protein
MAVLSAAERARVARWFQRDPNLGSCTFTKPDLIAAAASADDWAEANAAEYNGALPVAFRTASTAGQKALLLAYVIARRHGFNLIDGGD